MGRAGSGWGAGETGSEEGLGRFVDVEELRDYAGSGRYRRGYRERVIAADDFELDSAGDKGLCGGCCARALLGLGGLVGEAGPEEALAALEVADELDGAVAGSADAQADGDVALGRHDGLDAGDLHAGGEDALEVHHHGCPGEAFALEEAIEKAGTVEHGAVGRLLHTPLVVLALSLEHEAFGNAGRSCGPGRRGCAR